MVCTFPRAVPCRLPPVTTIWRSRLRLGAQLKVVKSIEAAATWGVWRREATLYLQHAARALCVVCVQLGTLGV
jgi:hypothetical protein